MLRARGISPSLKYIDPSHMIRSLPANARDANFCLRLVMRSHTGAGKTDVVIGSWRRRLTHVPIPAAVSSRKKVDTNGYLWQTVLSVTGQADDLLSAQRNVPPSGKPASVTSVRMAMYDTCSARTQSRRPRWRLLGHHCGVHLRPARADAAVGALERPPTTSTRTTATPNTSAMRSNSRRP